MAWTDFYTEEELRNFLSGVNPLNLFAPPAEAANVSRSGPFSDDIVGAGRTGKGGGGSGSGYINQIFNTPNIANNPILKPSSAVINKPNIFTQPKAVMKQTFPKPTTSSTRVQPQISPIIRNVTATPKQSPRIEQPAGREPFSLSDLNAQVSGNVIKRRTPMSSMGINRDSGNTRLTNFLRSPKSVIGAAGTVGPLGYMGARSLFEDNEEMSPVKTPDSAITGIMSAEERKKRNEAIANAPDIATRDAIISGKKVPSVVTPPAEKKTPPTVETKPEGKPEDKQKKSFLDRLAEVPYDNVQNFAYNLYYAGLTPEQRKGQKSPEEMRMSRAKASEKKAQESLMNDIRLAKLNLDFARFQQEGQGKAIENISTFKKAFQSSLDDYSEAGYIPFDDYSEKEMEDVAMKAFQMHNKAPSVPISEILRLLDEEKKRK